MPNHLAGETSPYLQQHAANPVDWYPWGDEAFSRARAQDRPVLLSIGYSACHWCHVMARECFENEKIARIMNASFINIKVDREERPDIDAIYMQAVQTMTGAGGWPLTIFLTPEGKPFYGGTYFPPEDRGGMPGFPRVLTSVAATYRDNRGNIEQIIQRLTAALSRLEVRSKTGGPLSADILDRAYLSLMHDFDKKNGGFGGAPKFPQPLVLEFLLRYYVRTQDKAALDMVDLTLTKMARGGIYDQLGGGFHRYTIDDAWLIPHFEKMLYDNALLLSVYFHTYLLTGKLLFRHVIESTIDWVIREMRSPNGGFYSSLDADIEGREGEYYLWTPEEVEAVVGPNVAPLADTYFGVSRDGNFQGKSVLHIASELPLGMQGISVQARTALLRRRNRRVRPGKDEKILASWNGLMLDSISQIAARFDRRDYLKVAVVNGEFITGAMIDRGELKHTWHSGTARIGGFLQDYSFVIRAFTRLHVATSGGKWLKIAIELANTMLEKFWDASAGMFYDSVEEPGLFVRPRNVFDEAIPCGASAATAVLLDLSRLTDNKRFEQIAVRATLGVREILLTYSMGTSNWLAALDFYLSAPAEIVLIGGKSSREMDELRHVISAHYLPDAVIAAFDPNDPERLTDLKIFEGKTPVGGRPAVYICRNFVCQSPVTDPVELRRQLKVEASTK
jgi:uncharacterized protein YyaL (SSP411 family)